MPKTNLQALFQVFGNETDPKLSDMKDSYSVNEVIDFFKPLITKEKNGIEITKGKLKELQKNSRLIPEIRSHWPYRYSGKQILRYYFETKPR